MEKYLSTSLISMRAYSKQPDPCENLDNDTIYVFLNEHRYNELLFFQI
jgi:hypothetical protein